MTGPDDERRTTVPATFGASPARPAGPYREPAGEPYPAEPAGEPYPQGPTEGSYPQDSTGGPRSPGQAGGAYRPGPAAAGAYPGGPVAAATAPTPVTAPPVTAPPVAADAPVLAASGARTGGDADAAGTATATALATADPLTRSLASPLAAPESHPPAPPGPPPAHGLGAEDVPGRGGPSGRLPRLRIGTHAVSPAALARLSPTPLPAGLVLGADRRRAAVTIRLFRPEPTRVTLVGGVWAGQLVAFRALALGARVVVLTADPAGWAGFGTAALGRAADRVEIHADGRPLPTAGTAQQPVLIVRDLPPGATAPTTPGSTSPDPTASGTASPGVWQAELTVLRRLDAGTAPALHDSDLCVLQRLSADESATAQQALRLPPDGGRFLQVMADDMLTLVGGGTDRHLWISQTSVEQHLLGAPRR
ncbi:hypothetical protein [Micromonospora sp. RL09-050-HVF-A]|uniref:hypothetical protein n=1 Tax=Micromonospora sp. RL09-050-HVF-A TaxID=1703433 RepID=UPI001C5EFF34|nr:hypothetical protein [Micromonospora sp. RL09-050-HVF-A]MBW4703043.1 hypothetical protein [Micromonospora sp. RL09-050-HVF-A]